jgi:hypothetical protein
MVGLSLGRVGYSPLWALLGFLFFPLLTAGLWFLAFARWPCNTAAAGQARPHPHTTGHQGSDNPPTSSNGQPPKG